jgi:beta-glucosidase
MTNIAVSANTDPLPASRPANSKDLYDTIAWVSVDVCNTGDVYGTEVPQVYLGSPADGAPPKQLRGFDTAHLQPGETKRVTFELTRRDLR